MGILEMDFERILDVPFFHNSFHSIMLWGGGNPFPVPTALLILTDQWVRGLCQFCLWHTTVQWQFRQTMSHQCISRFLLVSFYWLMWTKKSLLLHPGFFPWIPYKLLNKLNFITGNNLRLPLFIRTVIETFLIAFLFRC